MNGSPNNASHKHGFLPWPFRRARAGQLVLLCLALGVTVGVLWLAVSHRKGPGSSTGVPAQRTKIDAIVATLQAESLDESIDRLTDSASYHYPGYHSPRKGDQTNLEEMLANRRSVKLFGEISQREQSEREARCAEIFRFVLNRHSTALRTILEHAEDPSRPENSQSINATQLGLCWAMTAAAQYGSKALLRDQFGLIDAVEVDIERRLQKGSANISKTLAFVIRQYRVPDNRAQLNILWLYALNHRDEQLLDAIGVRCTGFPKSEVPVVPWDAKITWFDIPRRLEGIPLDTSKGVTVYAFFGWPALLYSDDRAQRRLVDELRMVAFRNKT